MNAQEGFKVAILIEGHVDCHLLWLFSRIEAFDHIGTGQFLHQLQLVSRVGLVLTVETDFLTNHSLVAVGDELDCGLVELVESL